MSIKTSVKYIKDEKFEVYAHNSDVKIYIDSKSQEHNPEGPGPLELFLSSLAGCIGVYAKKYLVRHEIDFTHLQINVQADFASDSPMRLINIKVDVATDAVFNDKREVFLKFIRNCPIHNTLVNTREVAIKLVQ